MEFLQTFRYRDAARCCTILHKERLAVLFMEKVVEINHNCLGEDHTDYSKELEVLIRMKAAVEQAQPFDDTVMKWFLSTRLPQDN